MCSNRLDTTFDTLKPRTFRIQNLCTKNTYFVLILDYDHDESLLNPSKSVTKLPTVVKFGFLSASPITGMEYNRSFSYA